MSNIPDSAKKVFTGVIYDVYQREQKLFDGRITIFEKAKRSWSVSIIPIKDHKILLAKERQPWMDLPKWSMLWWRVEINESYEEAAKRELLEESGLRTDDIELLLDENIDQKLLWKRSYFIARNVNQVSEISLDWWEEITLEWITRDFFVELCVNGDMNYPGFEIMILRAIVKNKLNEIKQIFFW